jgi:hypothetical protein
MRLLFSSFLFLSFASPAIAGTITGQIQTPSTGRGVPNGTLTFTLSQAAVVSGTATLAGNANCWTDSSGNVVGLPGDAAIVAPVLSSNLGSGTLPGGTYFVRYTWANGTGESQPSAERSLVLGSSGTLIVQAPLNVPPLAASMKVYIGTTSGGESLQGNVTVTNGVIAGNYNQAASLVNGAALPSSNTSACQIRFNDELQPSFTAYSVTLNNLNGAGIAGFPQKWYLSGGSNGTVNVSNGTPLYAGVVQYPQAIVSNPAANGMQSLNGPLEWGVGATPAPGPARGALILLPLAGGPTQGSQGISMQGTNSAGTALNHWFGVSQFGDMVWISDGNSQQPLTFAVGYTGLLSYNRLWPQFGSAITNSDVAISSGWGSTATYTVRGNDTLAQINITANGSGISLNPNVSLTYHDGSFGNPYAIAMVSRCDANPPQSSIWVATSNNTTSAAAFFLGTPLAGATYCVNILSMKSKN